ncbi:hypothetical protein C3L33_08115, partial [Rhododendron williamsianum]
MCKPVIWFAGGSSDVVLLLTTSDNLLISIQEKIKWADSMGEVDKKHKKEVEERVEEVKKSLSTKADMDFRGQEEIFSEPGGVMDYEEDRSRPKRYQVLLCIMCCMDKFPIGGGIQWVEERASDRELVVCHLPLFCMKLPVAMDANALTSREEMAVISRNMMTAMSSLVWDIFPYFNHPR